MNGKGIKTRDLLCFVKNTLRSPGPNRHLYRNRTAAVLKASRSANVIPNIRNDLLQRLVSDTAAVRFRGAMQ